MSISLGDSGLHGRPASAPAAVSCHTGVLPWELWMRRRKSRGLSVVAASLATVLMVGMNGAAAFADTTSGAPSGTSGNASDPYVTHCDFNGVPNGYCMYTSSD